MNCAAISAMLQSSTLVKSYNSPEERIHVVSFKRTKANHDKLPHLNNSLITRHKITNIGHNLHKLSSCVF